MNIRIHANATTTPRIRREIQQAPDHVTDRELAEKYGISIATVRRWRNRDSVEDKSHTPHKLNTRLTPEQERIVIELRRVLLLPLDDLLSITREFINPKVSRSALQRTLKRHGISNLKQMIAEMDEAEAEKAKSKSFKVYDPGYIHIDVKYLPKLPGDEGKRRYLFVAIDRATRWVFIQLHENKNAQAAQMFLEALHKASPIRIRTILTDNGKEFTDRLSGEDKPSGKHPFDQLCQAHGIEHRLTKPRHPQTNGMVERFNGRIKEVLATHHCDDSQSMEQLLNRYVYLYNHHIPQRALKGRRPVEMLRHWLEKKPECFVVNEINLPEPDTYHNPI